MILRHPWLLALWLLVPVLVYLRYARRRKPALHFGDTRPLPALPLSWAVHAHRALPAVYALGLALLVLALARPQKGLEESRVHAEAVDIVLLVDTSTSMRAEDFSTATRRQNRLDAARRVIERFIQQRPNDLIGIVAFAAMPYTLAPLTLDHAWLLLQMQRLQTGMLEDGTAIGDALASAVNRLRDSHSKSKVIVLLTDGINNRGALSPENAAQLAKALNIRIYTVGAGSQGGPPAGFGWIGRPYAPSEIDEASLRRIASVSGGRYFRATDVASLEKTYDEIDRMEKTKVKVEQYTHFEERFAPFAVAALLLLGLEQLLSLTRLGRLP